MHFTKLNEKRITERWRRKSLSFSTCGSTSSILHLLLLSFFATCFHRFSFFLNKQMNVFCFSVILCWKMLVLLFLQLIAPSLRLLVFSLPVPPPAPGLLLPFIRVLLSSLRFSLGSFSSSSCWTLNLHKLFPVAAAAASAVGVLVPSSYFPCSGGAASPPAAGLWLCVFHPFPRPDVGRFFHGPSCSSLPFCRSTFVELCADHISWIYRAKVEKASLIFWCVDMCSVRRSHQRHNGSRDAWWLRCARTSKTGGHIKAKYTDQSWMMELELVLVQMLSQLNEPMTEVRSFHGHHDAAGAPVVGFSNLWIHHKWLFAVGLWSSFGVKVLNGTWESVIFVFLLSYLASSPVEPSGSQVNSYWSLSCLSADLIHTHTVSQTWTPSKY